MSPVFVITPFLVLKALKTANSEKCVFSCQTSKVVPEPPSSLVFRRKPAPDVRHSVFCPEKPANSSPLNSSPLVTALSPLAFGCKSAQKRPQFPSSFSTGFFAARQPAEVQARSRQPPRWSVSPPSLSPLKSPLHPAVFFVQKALQTVARASKFAGFRWKAGSRRPLCSVFRFRAGKAANSSPRAAASV